MPSGWQLAAGFAARGGTPVWMVDVVLPNELIVVMEMRVFVDVLVVFGAGLDWMLRLVAHGAISVASGQWLGLHRPFIIYGTCERRMSTPTGREVPAFYAPRSPKRLLQNGWYAIFRFAGH